MSYDVKFSVTEFFSDEHFGKRPSVHFDFTEVWNMGPQQGLHALVYDSITFGNIEVISK